MTSFSALGIFFKIEKSIQIRLIFSGILSALSALSDLVSFGMLLPVVLSFTSPDKLQPYLKYFGVEHFIDDINISSYIILIFALIFIIAQVVKISILWINSSFIDRVKKNISTKMIYGIFNDPDWAENIKHQSYYLNLMTTEINLFIQMCIKSYVNIVHEIIILSFILILGYSYIKDTLFIILISMLPLLFFIKIINNYRLFRLAGYRKLADESKLTALQQIFILFKDIYVGQKKYFFTSVYETKLDRLLILERLQSIIRSSLKPISEIYTVLVISTIAFIFYDDISFGNGSVLTLLIATLVVIFKVLPALNKLQTSFYDIQYISETSKNILEIVSNVYSNKYHDNNNFHDQVYSDGFYIENLYFSYKNSDSIIINIPKLHIPSNSLIIIKGKSGSGKSTLVNLLLGILKPTRGSIKFQGKCIGYNDINYLNLIGYVGQNIYLVDGTLAENIAFGVEKTSIDMDRVSYLINAVGLGYLLNRNMLSLNQSVIGSDQQFSGGEKQRIGIARALYSSPNILLLDEITSSLDYENRKLIYKIIEEISKKHLCTIVLITHDEEILFDDSQILNL